MPAPFYHEKAVTVDGEQYRLVINFAAIDATESLLRPLTYADIVDSLLTGTAALSVQAKVVWGLLREHHPAMSIDEAMSLIPGETGATLGAAVGALITAAFPLTDLTEPKADAKGKNPRKPRGASKPS